MLVPILGPIISAIIRKSADKAWKKLSRTDKVLNVLKEVGRNSKRPEEDFESIYAHTLVEFGVEKERVMLEFFRNDKIINAFRSSFDKNDNFIFYQDAERFIEETKVGDDLREKNFNLKLEFTAFTAIFYAMVYLSRSPSTVITHQKLDEILELINKGSINDIRAENLKMIQGSLGVQLKEWFSTLGYSFGEYERMDDRFCEMIIKIPARRGFDTIFVKGIEKKTEIGDIDEVIRAFEYHKTDEGWLVASNMTTKGALDKAKVTENIFCYTFDELIDDHADFSRYFEWLKTFVNEQHIDTDYIPLACKRDTYDEDGNKREKGERYGSEEGWMEGYINQWIEDPCKEHISILGEFGTGKTWFTHHFAYEMMLKYEEAKSKGLKRPRVPLVVQLRDYSKKLESESLFSDFFFRKHEIPLPNYSAFEQLNRMGKLLLIFDGFDEMADKLDKQKMIDNFWELAKVVVPGAKAILSCRTEHFPEAKHGRALLNAELRASTAKLTGDPPQFEILELEKFDNQQIRAALLKKSTPQIVDRVMKDQDLLDLASRPVMLDFLLEALPDIETTVVVDLSRIYLYAITRKLERDVKSERTFTSTADKLYFMCELAWEMITTEKMSLNYSAFPDRLKNLFGAAVSEDKELDHWRYDMMGNTLLIRNDDGDYKPAHRSLLEFLVAYKLVAGLGLMPDDFIKTASLQSELAIDSGAEREDYTWNRYFYREFDENGEIKKIAPLRNFSSDDRAIFLSQIGSMADTVLRFVYEITSVEETRLSFHSMLAEILNEFKDGNRDTTKEQSLLQFVYRFRTLSQGWEKSAGKSDFASVFWKNYYDNELLSNCGNSDIKTIFVKNRNSETISFEMVEIEVGSFLMGDEDYNPIHQVDITKSFMMATTQVTQEIYHTVIGNNPSKFKGGDLPVETVSWFDAIKFCNMLSEILNLPSVYTINDDKVVWDQNSLGFRFPTETEWEYACRSGCTSKYASGDSESDLESMAWFDINSKDKTHPVKIKAANNLGLFDMHGNVLEWVWDCYGNYPDSLVKDPVGSNGSDRVLRGGSWAFLARGCRSACRSRLIPDYRSSNTGFRLVLPRSAEKAGR